MNERSYLFGPLIPLVVYVVLAFFLGLGPGEWDGVNYVAGALAWVEGFPHLGENHWALRHPLVMPMAVSIWVLGIGDFSATLPNLIYGAGLILVSYYFSTRLFGSRAGFFVALLVAASPSLVLRPLEIEIRGVEVFFAALALWIFVSTTVSERPAIGSYFLVGAFAGVSWLCRESAGYLVPTLVLAAIFIAPEGQRIKALAGSILGFAGIVVCELAVYSLAAGDAFYRYKIDLGHGDTPLENGLGADFVRADYADMLLEPFQRLLFADVQAIVVLTAILAATHLFQHRHAMSSVQIRAVFLFSVAGVLSFFFSGLLLSLEIPRYYPMLAYAGCFVTAVALGHLTERWNVMQVLSLAFLIVVIGATLTDYRAGNARGIMRAGSDLALRIDEPIGAHPRMHQRLLMALRLQGLTGEEAHAEVKKVSWTALPSDDLVFSFGEKKFGPETNWVLYDRETVPSKLSQKLLQQFLPAALLPTSVADANEMFVEVYRVR